MPFQLHRPHSNPEIAEALGWTFTGGNHGLWQHGAIHKDAVLIRVTLDKTGVAEKYRYADRFLSPSAFLWKSQAEVTPKDSKAADYRAAGRTGKEVHLFVRRRKRQKGGGSPPHWYLGRVRFVSEQGSKPITIGWELEHEVPSSLWRELLV